MCDDHKPARIREQLRHENYFVTQESANKAKLHFWQFLVNKMCQMVPFYKTTNRVNLRRENYLQEIRHFSPLRLLNFCHVVCNESFKIGYRYLSWWDLQRWWSLVSHRQKLDALQRFLINFDEQLWCWYRTIGLSISVDSICRAIQCWTEEFQYWIEPPAFSRKLFPLFSPSEVRPCIYFLPQA